MTKDLTPEEAFQRAAKLAFSMRKDGYTSEAVEILTVGYPGLVKKLQKENVQLKESLRRLNEDQGGLVADSVSEGFKYGMELARKRLEDIIC